MGTVRFAPSPTSQPKVGQNGELEGVGLHIGSVRTAVFNYLLKLKGDKFLFRLEDTDEKRSNDLCTQAIIRDFNWLDIKFDMPQINGVLQKNEFCIKQSERKAIYKSKADALVANNRAEIRDGAIWFRTPREKIGYYDGVQEFLSIPKEEMKDFVIIKETGQASFYMAMTVDDNLMGVTDVIRGQEHIPTTFKQLALCKAMGIEPPNFYHIPLIMNPDGSKMSKRQTNGQVSLWEFGAEGYVKDVIIRYVMSLGWSKYNEVVKKHGPFFSMKQAALIYSPDQISKTNVRFDYAALRYHNRKYLDSLTKEQFGAEVVQYAKQFKPKELEEITKNGKLQSLIDAYHKKVNVLSELFNSAWINSKPNISDERWAYLRQYNKSETVVDLFLSKLKKIDDVSEILGSIKEKLKLSNNEIVQPIRLAITGTNIAPDLNMIVKLVGKDECIKRLGSFAEQMKDKLYADKVA